MKEMNSIHQDVSMSSDSLVNVFTSCTVQRVQQFTR